MNNDVIVLNDSIINNLFPNRIKQDCNSNSYSELFIFDDEVYKIYTKYFDLVEQNINILDNIFTKYNGLSNIKELVLPNKYLLYNGHIVGFTMPYIKGKTFFDIMNEKKYDKEYIKNIFIKLIKLLDKFKKLSFEFAIGDLHERNIIVDKDNNINIIDCDSFILDNNTVKSDDGNYYRKYNIDSIKYGDYYAVFCMMCMYIFKREYYSYESISQFIEKNSEYLNKDIYNILNKIVDNNFVMTEEDINKLFSYDNLFIEIDREELTKKLDLELERISRIVGKNRVDLNI